MVEITAFRDGLVRYAADQVAPKLDSKGQFLLGAAANYLAAKSENLLRALDSIPFVQTMGLVQGDQMDWDALYTALLAQMQRQGKLVLDVPIVGRMSFDAQDLRDLHKCITGGVN